MRRGLDFIYKASGYAAALFLLAIALIVFAQVCVNLADKIYVYFGGHALGLTIPSYADFTGFFLAASSFLALAYTLRAGGHIRVTLLTGLLPVNLRRVFEIIVLMTGFFMAAYASYFMLGLVIESYQFGDRSSGMVSVPLWIPQSLVLLGLSILALALGDELIRVLKGNTPTYDTQTTTLFSD